MFPRSILTINNFCMCFFNFPFVISIGSFVLASTELTPETFHRKDNYAKKMSRCAILCTLPGHSTNTCSCITRHTSSINPAPALPLPLHPPPSAPPPTGVPRNSDRCDRRAASSQLIATALLRPSTGPAAHDPSPGPDTNPDRTGPDTADRCPAQEEAGQDGAGAAHATAAPPRRPASANGLQP